MTKATQRPKQPEAQQPNANGYRDSPSVLSDVEVEWDKVYELVAMQDIHYLLPTLIVNSRLFDRDPASHFLAYFEMLERDRGRLADCRARANISPLGSGAVASVWNHVFITSPLVAGVWTIGGPLRLGLRAPTQ